MASAINRCMVLAGLVCVIINAINCKPFSSSNVHQLAAEETNIRKVRQTEDPRFNNMPVVLSTDSSASGNGQPTVNRNILCNELMTRENIFVKCSKAQSMQIKFSREKANLRIIVEKMGVSEVLS